MHSAVSGIPARLAIALGVRSTCHSTVVSGEAAVTCGPTYRRLALSWEACLTSKRHPTDGVGTYSLGRGKLACVPGRREYISAARIAKILAVRDPCPSYLHISNLYLCR